MTQARCWCGTLNAVEAGFNGQQWLEQKKDKIKYGIGQLEQGHETEHWHFQFYIQLHRSQRLNWLKQNIDTQAHFEPARGTAEQNKAYCSKEDTRIDGPWEVGICSTQGKQTGLDEATAMVASGTPLVEVARTFPVVWVRHGKGLVFLRQTLCLDADRRQFGPDGPELWVLWGPTGTGKSRFAKEHWPDAFWKAPYSQWWDGYGTHETVILDDFRDDGMRLTDFQRLIDHYPYWVEIKGGSLPMLAKRYVITSNHDPETWYHKSDTEGTVMRRVTDFAERHGRLLHFPLSPTTAEGVSASWPDHPWHTE
ncbi:replication associated protein [Dipodfec virus RodF1_123]|uniref:ATP-dependent helicase Rep n=1 Tax=Dipodfec virus RodF1_123 TaxID=2929290 RepID=A0A976N2A3_9VIRU|nr:replication associated protein [Dipodfec virus RodF1_123]